MKLDKLLSKTESTEILGIRPTKLNSLIRSGDLRARRIGRRVVVSESELKRFQDSLPMASALIKPRGGAR